uniref:MAGUK p55 subfamily member 4-like n=1 Tax=Centroberyx gerrardi TaxID=166262 RepID=UPI003AAC0EEA
CQPLQVHTCIKPLTPADNGGCDGSDTGFIQTSTRGEPGSASTTRVHPVLGGNRGPLRRPGFIRYSGGTRVRFDDPDEEDINFDEDESDVTDGVYLAGFRRSFRLWRRTSCRRRRQSCHSCSPNGSAPSYPYEEVVTYRRPPQDSHRLIVLVGASGVGVTELRKRLVRLNPSTFQGPVPHTTRPIREGEETGREYHFVTKELFEYMVCNHRFLEYGEYKGHLYGTSSDSIGEVLKRGPVCIIDVEPHSIQSLRTKNLKPYVVFIKPPSLDRLRQTRKDARIITNYTINRPFTDEDFVELEEASRLMESKYRQFFDSVLVNDGLQDACMQLCSVIQQAQDEPQWVPACWSKPEE